MEARAAFGNDFFIFLAACIFHHCELVDELGGVFRVRRVSPRWLRMPLEEEAAMDVDEEAEGLQGTSGIEVMDGFLRQLFPLLLRPAVSFILMAALQ